MERQTFKIENSLNNGIERITYIPDDVKHETPILFVHGMWHGAWCWSHWQEIFAQQGWVTHAISLQGHGSSENISTRFKTMKYYLNTLNTEVDSFDSKPIVVGHSMGGALIQWYLKYKADDLPATVLVAPWTSHSTLADGTSLHMKRDFWGFMLTGFTLSTDPLIRNPDVTGSLLISEGALYSNKELHSKLVSESALVLNQHNPPLWKPKKSVKTPMLWLAGEKDAVITLKGAEKSAQFYNADFYIVKGTAHNIMIEKTYKESAEYVEKWLVQQSL